MNLESSFSVYNIVEKQHPGNIFLTQLNHMFHFSKVIEHDIINYELNSPFYVGMQSFHKLLPILSRYKQIAQINGASYVFGIPDAQIEDSSGLNLMPINPDSELAREWFLVVNHPDYARILSAREIEIPASNKTNRSFEAILTSDPEIVAYVSDAMHQAITSADLMPH